MIQVRMCYQDCIGHLPPHPTSEKLSLRSLAAVDQVTPARQEYECRRERSVARGHGRRRTQKHNR